MTEDDVSAVIDLQRAGAVAGLAEVFPQDQYPFPRQAIIDRWRAEIGDPEIETFVALSDAGRLVGFAATSGSELFHFGTAIDTWGDGTASELHDIVVGLMCLGDGQPTLFVFADNRRGRRFYDKHGWQSTGATSTGSFPPHPTLLEYTLPRR